MSIRSATLADLVEITTIYEEAVQNGSGSFELTPPDLAEMTARFEKITRLSYPYLVFEVDGTIAGYAYGSAYRERPAYRWTVENSIYVSPAFKGRGIGSDLLNELIDRCTRLGFRQMIGIIGDSENLGSINLHKSLGFHHVGTMSDTGFKHGRWLDTVIYQRSLGEGASGTPDMETYPGNMFKPA